MRPWRLTSGHREHTGFVIAVSPDRSLPAGQRRVSCWLLLRGLPGVPNG
jgi:hypothetical protein